MSANLIIDPGSTSTKIGVFSKRERIFSTVIRHSQDELSQYGSIVSQLDFRKQLVVDTVARHNVRLDRDSIFMAIGGLIRPGPAGVYRVTEDMVRDLNEARYDEHASNLGALIARGVAEEYGAEAYIADAVTADEMDDVARISGIPEITRLGRSHTLNQKYIAGKAANDLNMTYASVRLVVAHLGGGISVTAHRNGRMVDTNAARGEGPFCIDRAGGVNSFELAKLCFSGRYTRDEMLDKISGGGGIVAYLGTRDFREVEKRARSCDTAARGVYDAMVYQIAKEIAAQTVALEGRPDAIVLTGGMANSRDFCNDIAKRVAYLGKVMIYPGEGELEALAEYADGIQRGALKAIEYKREARQCVSKL